MKTIVKKPETNLMSSQLLGLIKKAAKKWVSTIAEFRKLWEEIKEQGQKEGFQEKQLRASIRDELDRLGMDNKFKRWYFFNSEKVKEKQRLKNRAKGLNIQTFSGNGNGKQEEQQALGNGIKFNAKSFNPKNIEYYDIAYLREAVLYFYERQKSGK